jgi:hypothetical protein
LDDATAVSLETAINVLPDEFQSQGRDVGFRIVRVAEDGERYLPHRFRDGLYRVADPALGRTKHHAGNQIAVRADEIEEYLRKGFLLRMRGEVSEQVNLISPAEIKRELL